MVGILGLEERLIECPRRCRCPVSRVELVPNLPFSIVAKRCRSPRRFWGITRSWGCVPCLKVTRTFGLPSHPRYDWAVTSPKKTRPNPANRTHRKCGSGHWFQRDHAEILIQQMSQARKKGLQALRKFLASLDEDLRKELSSTHRKTSAGHRRPSHHR